MGEVLEGQVLIDHINDFVDREDVAYKRVKTVLKRKGYTGDDFKEGGALYGYSTNELIKLARPNNGD